MAVTDASFNKNNNNAAIGIIWNDNKSFSTKIGKVKNSYEAELIGIQLALVTSNNNINIIACDNLSACNTVNKIRNKYVVKLDSIQ